MMNDAKKIGFGLFAALLVTGTACGEDKAKKEPQARPSVGAFRNAIYLTDLQHLVRVSLDLRGTRPTAAEIASVENASDPQARIRELATEFLEDRRFRERVKEIWNEGFLARQDRPFFPGPPQLLGLLSEDDFARAATQEPLELIAHVVMNDRPFTEIVTADYTVSNEALAAYYDITRPTNEGRGWVESQYTDGRPNAGVLSTTSFYTRWTTTDSNQNRGRANAWTRAILCYDFFTRDIIVDTNINLADPNVVNNAVRTNPSCVGCHQSLDPLASHFFGYFIPEDVGEGERSYPIKTYSADLENRWQQGTGRDPGYFGMYAESPNLASLGEQIAADPGFSTCSVRRFQSVLTGVSIKELETTGSYIDETDRLHDFFMETDYDAKKLVLEIVMSDNYRLAGPTTAMPFDDAKRLHGLKLLAPEALNRMLRDLTGNSRGQNPDGFGWKMEAPEGYDLLENDIYGFRMMAGGYDGNFSTAPAHTVNATHVLTLRMASADAAGRLVDAEFAESAGNRRLLTEVSASTNDEQEIKEQIVLLNKLLYGEIVDVNHADVTDAYTLWTTVAAREDNTYAWKVLVAAMLSDVRVAFY